MLLRIFRPIFIWLNMLADRSRFTRSPDDIAHVAVVIRRVDRLVLTHSGIAHRSKEGVFVIHMGGHLFAVNEANDGSWAFAIPMISDIEGEYVSGFCRKVARSRSLRAIPYGFEFEPDVAFDSTTGEFLAHKQSGLTCATFAESIFPSAGMPLVLLDTWPIVASEEDKAAREWLMSVWESSGKEHLKEQAAKIRPSISARRVSPEQVSGACLQRFRPAIYEKCRANGKWLLEMVDLWFGPPDKPV